MWLIPAIEFSCILILAIFVITQIILPAVQGRQMFPMFKPTAELEAELAKAKQEVADAKLANEVAATKAEAAALKQPEVKTQ